MKKASVLVLLAVVVGGLAAAADPPAVGTKAPAFSLPSQDGSQVALEKSRGKWVVLYFYPKDFTSGCTVEARNFQRDSEKYAKANAVVFGVSLDTVDSHKEFCAKEGLNFRLLSDADRAVAKAYGSLTTHQDKEYAARNTFLIDPEGVVRKVYLKVSPATHSDEVLADLAMLKAAK
ncbi:MAG TPA: peroxiredoxin [Thermoanaerobaculia bacterium]|nr:peroxiredoxin [Thermoanaerobaculia bacterium]